MGLLRKFGLRLLGLSVATIIGVLIFKSIFGTARCETSASGTIVGFASAPMPEQNPTSSQRDYRPGHRPIIKIEAEGSREVMAETERVPSPRRIGDSVRVCFTGKNPQQARIVD
jgi:hypothetical protein